MAPVTFVFWGDAGAMAAWSAKAAEKPRPASCRVLRPYLAWRLGGPNSLPYHPGAAQAGEIP